MRRLIAITVLGVASCAVDPLPEPPSPDPDLVGEFQGTTCQVCDGQAKLSGGPGSVESADSVWVADLDNATPPVTAPVQSDGSFELFLFAIEGDELRLQARRGRERSEPLDVVMALDGVLEPAPRPLSECFVLAAERAVVATAVGDASFETLRIEHTCAAPMTVDSVAMRAGTAGYSVTAVPTPVILAAGEFLDVEVQFAPAAAGLQEDVLLIEVSSPAVDRRAVTLFGDGTQ